MKPQDFHRRVMWGLWTLVIAIGFLLLLLLQASSAERHSREAQMNYLSQTPEGFWGDRWPDIMQFYYPHDHAHGLWFNRKTNCCGGKDCFPARSGTVKWTPEGYRVALPDGGYAMVPDKRGPANPDDTTEDRATVCLVDYGAKLKYTVSGDGVAYHDTQYRIRPNCFWSGRPRI